VRGLLTALQHADSAFPGGSFAFSNGLEGLAALGTPLDRGSLSEVVTAVIRHRWAPADRVALLRAYRAGDDLDEIGTVDRELEAATLIEPLRTGSRRNGGAFLAAHWRLGTSGASALKGVVEAGRALGHLAVVQGFVWRAVGMTADDAVAISG